MSRLDYCKYELVGDCYDWKNDNCDWCNIFRAYCEGARRAKESQNNRPFGDWTPVTEQLPKIDEALPLCDQISDEVLGTDNYGNIRHVYLTNCGYLKPTFCTVEEGMSVDIVAWMALPEPYEPKTERRG